MNLDSGPRVGAEVESLGGYDEIEDTAERDVWVVVGKLSVPSAACGSVGGKGEEKQEK